MKRILLTFLLLTLFVFPSFTLANTSDSINTRKREEIQERSEQKLILVEQKREEIRERLEEKKASVTARLTKARQDRVQMYWQKLFRRMIAHTERLETLIARIESRLTVIEENNEGIVTTQIHKDIETAKSLLSDTKTKLESTNELISDVLESEDPSTTFEVFRTYVDEIHENLKEVHSLLVKIIGDIKGLRIAETSEE